MEPIDPALFERPDLRAAQARHDIGALYRALGDIGLTQRQIAERTGQSQSEVAAIVAGRQVMVYDVLVRIAEAFDIPREYMGLSFGAASAYAGCGSVANASKETDEEMRRRALLLRAPVALWGSALLGEVPKLLPPAWDAEPLPTRVGMGDVARVDHQTALLRTLASQHGGHADLARAIATQSTQLMTVSGEDQVKAKLATALTRQHTLVGWCCADSLLDGHAWHHLQQALTIGPLADDGYQLISTLRIAGNTEWRRGRPNDALKYHQLALSKLPDLPRDHPQAQFWVSWLHLESASALATMGLPDQARSSLAAAQDGWMARDELERADFDLAIAHVHLSLDQLAIAERFAATSMRTWSNVRNRGGVLMPDVTFAIIHLKAGDPGSLGLAKAAIDRVATLSSPRARQKLLPLARALDNRPGSDARELARTARHLATIRT